MAFMDFMNNSFWIFNLKQAIEPQKRIPTTTTTALESASFIHGQERQWDPVLRSRELKD
jgi:hypothetical protein